MLRRVTQDILRDDEFRVEIKSNFISVDLGDDLSFKTQFEKFKDYKFETYLNEIHGLYNYNSLSNILFYYVYELNNEYKKHFMYHTQIDMLNDSRIPDLRYIDGQNEGTVNAINSTINSCFNSVSNIRITAAIETTFYKSIVGEYTQDDDESEEENTQDNDYESEEEYNDYLPTLELPFFQDSCVICMENEPQILIIPCLHICHCILCDEEGLINKCPMCREEIRRKVLIKK